MGLSRCGSIHLKDIPPIDLITHRIQPRELYFLPQLGHSTAYMSQEGIRILGYRGNYTGHSFRRGAATSARLAGLSDQVIQLLGRWKSTCYRLYIDTPPEWIHNASSRHQKTQPFPLYTPPSVVPSSPPPSYFDPHQVIPNPTTQST